MKPEYIGQINLGEEIIQTKKGLELFHKNLQDQQMDFVLNGKERPDGLRLSTDCPVRRVKQYFDPFWRVPFDQGIARRGFMIEAMVQAYYDLVQMPVQYQVELDYGIGSTAFDVIHDTTHDVSIKSSVHEFPKPSTQNISQELRMLYAAQENGMQIDSVTWFMVSVSTLQGYLYKLDADDIDLTIAGLEFERVKQAYEFYIKEQSKMKPVEKYTGWDDPHFWSDTFGLEATSNPFKQPPIDATGHVENLIHKYTRVNTIAAENKKEVDTLKSELKPLVIERLSAEGLEAGIVKAWSYPYNLQITKSGSFVIRQRKEEV